MNVHDRQCSPFHLWDSSISATSQRTRASYPKYAAVISLKSIIKKPDPNTTCTIYHLKIEAGTIITPIFVAF